MKILFLHKWLIMGGVEKILINYLELLQNETDLHIDLLIAFDTPRSSLKTSLPEKIKTYYVFDEQSYIKQQELYKNRRKNIYARLNYKVSKLNEKRYCKKILNDMMSKYDVIINFSNHFDPFINFRKNNKPLIRWQHLALREISNKDVKREISYLRKYHKIVAICKDMKRDIQEKSNISFDKIVHIYNPLNFSEIKLYSKENISIDKPYLVQVARLDKIKRHGDLIDIYLELRKMGISQKLYIIGDGDEYHSLANKIRRLDLEEYCILLGEISNPYPYIKNADLFLHTSEREGLPTVLLESAILETIIVTMDCPTGPREITDNGNCGALIKFGDKKEFIEKAFQLLSDNELKEQYKQRMKSHLNLFSEKLIKKEFRILIEKIISKEQNNEKNKSCFINK